MVQSSKNDPYQWKYLCIEGKWIFFKNIWFENIFHYLFILLHYYRAIWFD